MDTPQYSREVRARAIEMVRELEPEVGSRSETIRSVAPKIGCTPKTLHKWIRNAGPAEVAAARDKGPPELEQNVAELRRADEILRKAIAAALQRQLRGRRK